MPLSVPVPFPLSTNVTPLGSAPDSEIVGVGVPVVVTVKVPATPTVNVVLVLLEIAGAWLTVMLSGFVADCEPAELESVTFTVKLTGLVLAGPLGVPVMAPVLPFRVNPAGNDPAETE